MEPCERCGEVYPHKPGLLCKDLSQLTEQGRKVCPQLQRLGRDKHHQTLCPRCSGMGIVPMGTYELLEAVHQKLGMFWVGPGGRGWAVSVKDPEDEDEVVRVSEGYTVDVALLAVLRGRQEGTYVDD